MIPNFRAWLKKEKEMIDVDEIHWSDGQLDFIGDGITFKCESDDLVLMQSTGLKDKNGKEIFEGDIVTDGHTTGDIKNHPTLGFYMVDENGVERWFSDHATIEDFEEDVETAARILEIIGNIYENPELLK